MPNKRVNTFNRTIYMASETTNSTWLDAALFLNGIIQAEISPISDARGTAEYKSLLLRQLFYAHFIKLFPELINVEELV